MAEQEKEKKELTRKEKAEQEAEQAK